jgi:hypothetical protein
MKVIYVCGYGRSGSTLLGRLLAMRTGAVAVGEVTHLASANFLRRARCACGEAYPRCGFWCEVDRRLTALDTDQRELSQRRRRLLEGLPGLMVPQRLLRRLLRRCAFSEHYPTVPFAEGVSVLATVADTAIVDISKTTSPTANRPRLLHAAGLDVELWLPWRPAREVITAHRAARRRRQHSASWWRSAATVSINRPLAFLSAHWCAWTTRSRLPMLALADVVAQAAQQTVESSSLDHAIAGNRSRHLPIDRESQRG